MITCANEPSKAWLTRTVSGLGELLEGAEVAVGDSKDLPKRPRVLVRIPDTSEVNTVITRLRTQNPELKTTDLSVMSRKVTEREQTLSLSIEPDSFRALTRSNFKVFRGTGRVIFRTLNDGKMKPEDENPASKSPSDQGGLGCPQEPWIFKAEINLLAPIDDYSGRTAPLTSKCCILYIY